MALNSLDAFVAGAKPPIFMMKGATGTMVAGRPISTWGLSGIVGAGNYDTTLNGVVLSGSSTAGALPRGNPSSGEAKLMKLSAVCTQAGKLLLCDRLWHNGGINITSTSAQNITSPTWPSRCPTSGSDNTASTDGYTVLLGVEVSTQTGAASPSISVSYTNSAGTSSRTSQNILGTSSTTPVRTFHLMSLTAGDNGVRSVQSITLSASWVSGTINLVAYRVLAEVDIMSALVPGSIDAITGGAPIIYDDSVLFFIFIPSVTTSSNITTTYVEAHG